MKLKPTSLVCMRHDRMVRTHPEQDNTKFCSKCGQRVGIYPSGQRELARNPHMKIVCDGCAGDDVYLGVPAEGALEEARGSRRR